MKSTLPRVYILYDTCAQAPAAQGPGTLNRTIRHGNLCRNQALWRTTDI